MVLPILLVTFVLIFSGSLGLKLFDIGINESGVLGKLILVSILMTLVGFDFLSWFIAL